MVDGAAGMGSRLTRRCYGDRFFFVCVRGGGKDETRKGTKIAKEDGRGLFCCEMIGLGVVVLFVVGARKKISEGFFRRFRGLRGFEALGGLAVGGLVSEGQGQGGPWL